LTTCQEWDPRRWQALSPRGWEKGVQGAQAPWQGVWGMCPQGFKRGGELLTLAHPPRVGPKALANPEPTGVGKGVEGAAPPPRGLGGCAPKIFKEGESSQPLQTCHEWGPKRCRPSAHEGGKTGEEGAKPLAVCPTKPLRAKTPPITLAACHKA